ncbi:MAG: competence protein ComEA [Bradymonadia bacterium]
MVINGVLGAGYYAERWESLPAFPPPLPSRSELLVVVEDMPEVALETRRQPDRRVAPAENDPAAAEEPVAASGPPTGQPGRRVNINSASSRELESLSGIGPSLASRIVEARPYRAVDDLLRVRGIGPSTLARFQGSVVVE